MQASLTWFIH